MLRAEIQDSRQVIVLLTCLAFLLPVSAQQKSASPERLAPGWSELEFEPPAPGKYQLPPLGTAGDGDVLGGSGDVTRLHSLMGDKVVVLSFIYSSCSEANGCPLATHVLERVQNRLIEDSGKGQGVRFISLSFDPGRDTPDVMQSYGRRYVADGFDWVFLTTRGEPDLEPILQSYGQVVIRDPGLENDYPGNLSHVLRVFLVDQGKRIRNVYSASFLHADSMINDIRTLQLESLAGQNPEGQNLQGPGDFRQGYAGAGYQTRAQSLPARLGAATDLRGYAEKPPLGLPSIPAPADNPITTDKINLGRRLFFDRRLSHNNTMSCAMCHVPEQGFSSNEMATAVGIEGRTVRRNSPTIYNVAYLERLFLDGRETSLEQQIWGPLLAHNEMGNPSVGRVIEKISRVPGYPELFRQAFDGRSVSMETVGMALASFERVLVSANSPFDRWYFAGEQQAMTAEQQSGFHLFTGKAGCSNCHLVTPQWALFTDQGMHNTGIGYGRAMAKSPAESRILIAPGEYITVRGDVVADAAEPLPADLGLYEITEVPDDRWKYRTPSLRNVALTAPYMHDGSISTLLDVIKFYNDGGISNELLDPLIHPLGLTKTEMEQLRAFLNALTGDNVDIIVADAFAAPVGNTE